MLPKLLLARLFVVLLLLLWVARIAVTRTVVIKRTPLDIPLLLFVGSATLSTVFAENRNVALFGNYTRYDGLLTLLTYAALFWLSVQSLGGRGDARALFRVVLVTGYVVAAVAILQSLHDSIMYGTFATAFGTFGNANVLGAFLALVFGIATCELMLAQTMISRILFANVLVVTGLALVLSFSRSSWFAATIGVVFIVVTRPRRLRLLALVAPAVGLLVLGLVAGYSTAGHGQLEHALVDRARTLLDPRTVVGRRSGIWGDTLRLVASRPVLGYGPDNVGLVFPRFQTGDWGLTSLLATGRIREPIDKAHAEILQVAATQGAIGVATYLLIQVAFLRALWRARRNDDAIIAGAGWISYQLVVQLNFTALAAALPFWIFSGAAVVAFNALSARTMPVDARRGYLLLPAGVALAAAVAWWGAIIPYLADARVRDAVDADYSGRPEVAQRLAAEARELDPWESVYAVEVGNLAFEQGEWQQARAAYQRAAGLGTFNDLVYRNLAIADRYLGLLAEGKEAALQAVELNRFDPANQALLAEFETVP